jgi:hypothetical protein
MTIYFYDDFIGADSINSTKDYSGSDHEIKFNENLKVQPDTWYYRDTKITYTHNNVGHRCRNPDELNFENYVLFTGCSHTYGVGLELEKSYTYLLSEKLNCDYYNLAQGGTGLDIMFYNLNIWLDRYPKPKHVFVQWTDPTRFLGDRGHDEKIGILGYTPEGHWSTSNTARKFILLGEETGYWNLRAKMFHLMLKEKFKKLELPYTYISFLGEFHNTEIMVPERFFYHNSLDYARDCAHFGNKTNQDLADRIYDSLK